jgi:hypothetical protein
LGPHGHSSNQETSSWEQQISNRKRKNSKVRQAQGQRKTSQRKTSRRKVTGASIVLVELAHHHNSAAIAIAEFSRIGLTNARLFGVPCCGSERFFAVSRVPSGVTVNDCTIMEWAGDVVAYTHGTDCNTTRLVTRDLAAGVTSPWENCSRFAAGGAFHRVEFLNMN